MLSLPILFMAVGLYSIVNPLGITLQDREKSYNVDDLTRGWGMYSITIGAILKFPQHKKLILLLCFSSSIIWHLLIVNKNQWTTHHKQAIFLNALAFILTCNTF